jgi:hypothetical protein
MSEKNHFVIWKGIRTGPFTKEELEREFTEGKMGLVRTVQVDGKRMPAREFVADIETRRREEELEEQIQIQAQHAEAARLESDRKEEEHRRQLEDAAKRPAGKSTPPPIPDVNPWAPQSAGNTPPLGPRQMPPTPRPPGISWWDGKGPVVTASILCLVCFLSGQIFRELSGLAVMVIGVTLMIRKRISAGAILVACIIISYGVGFLLSDLIHDYISKNFPN